jgi:hypothetical protein
VTAFYFAWVDPTDKTFGVQHQVYDEVIFSFRRKLEEASIPSLTLETKNLRGPGYLSPGRKTWAWLSWTDPRTGVVRPLFFGMVTAVPESVFAEVVTLVMTAKPLDYMMQKQRAAETLKYRPFYDDVFIDQQKRDDPDTILEAHTKLWHVDPLTGVVTASDIIEAEDGNVTFTESDAFYDNFDMNIGRPPLTYVQMDATVSWTQTAVGYVDMGNKVFTSYSGDGIINEWPRPLSSLQGGWSVQYSNAVDTYGISNTFNGSFNNEWSNQEKYHNDGDTMSVSESMSGPAFLGPFLSYDVTVNQQIGLQDPFTVDADGDPAPTNIPASVTKTTMFVPLWSVSTALVLRYDAARQRSERVIFTMHADLQRTANSPLVTEETEFVTKTGADVGVPIFKSLNWSSVAGQGVALGVVIFPDNPTLPGGTSAQICVSSGVAGSVEPTFSDVVGQTTTDGTVTWSSLGNSSSPSVSGDWTPVTSVPLGKIILPRLPLFVAWTTLIQPGLAQFPPTGVTVALGQIVRASNGSYQVCDLSGRTGKTEPAFSTVRGVTTVDGSVTWVSLGMSLPTGTNYFICTQAGTTGELYVIPSFDNTLHATTTDGTVVWTSIGSGDIPAGGTPGHVNRRSYFPTDRGLQSLEYLISVARAHMLMRARAVRITFECPFDKVIDLTCRMSATIVNPRLPGGVATGKIVATELSAHGDRMLMIGSVTIACTVGRDGAITADAGTPTYVESGYVTGYQTYESSIVLPQTLTDVGYTPPVDEVNDDGLVFPLDRNQIVVSEAVRGTLDEQRTGIKSAFESARQAALITQYGGDPLTAQLNGVFGLPYVPPSLNLPQYGGTFNPMDRSVLVQRYAALAAQNSVAYQLSLNPIWYDLQLKPVNGGPFDSEYLISVTTLNIPRQIDLEASS